MRSKQTSSEDNKIIDSTPLSTPLSSRLVTLLDNATKHYTTHTASLLLANNPIADDKYLSYVKLLERTSEIMLWSRDLRDEFGGGGGDVIVKRALKTVESWGVVEEVDENNDAGDTPLSLPGEWRFTTLRSCIIASLHAFSFN